MDEVNNSQDAGGMRPCGCLAGRPCTCELQTDVIVPLACGNCQNCQRNKLHPNRTKNIYKCVKYKALLHNLQYDTIQLTPTCKFEMRKPTWDVTKKSLFYTRMLQHRLALVDAINSLQLKRKEQLSAQQSIQIELEQAECILEQKMENQSNNGALTNTLKSAELMRTNMYHRESVQLISAETMQADGQKQLELLRNSIESIESSLNIITAYVHNMAADRIQIAVHDYINYLHRRRSWNDFIFNARLAAVVAIQSFVRMRWGMQLLTRMKYDNEVKRRNLAANQIIKFFKHIQLLAKSQYEKERNELLVKIKMKRLEAIRKLIQTITREFLSRALKQWKLYKNLVNEANRALVQKSIITIQRFYRGAQVRLAIKRRRFRLGLSPTLGKLVDNYVCNGGGDIWKLLQAIDYEFKRLELIVEQEKIDAKTFNDIFTITKIQQQERMCAEWLKSTVIENPIIHGALEQQKSYRPRPRTNIKASPTMTSLPQLWKNSPVHKDLEHIHISTSPISPNLKSKASLCREEDLFPPHIIRTALADGYMIDDVISVMRGLHAKNRNVENNKLVRAALDDRRRGQLSSYNANKLPKVKYNNNGVPPRTSKKHEDQMLPSNAFNLKVHKRKVISEGFINTKTITKNMLLSLPFGLNSLLSDILFYAAFQCINFQNKEDCKFVLAKEQEIFDPFQDFENLPSELLKVSYIKRLRAAISPYLSVFTNNFHCYTAKDFLQMQPISEIDLVHMYNFPQILAAKFYDTLEDIPKQTMALNRRRLQQQLIPITKRVATSTYQQTL